MVSENIKAARIGRLGVKGTTSLKIAEACLVKARQLFSTGKAAVHLNIESGDVYVCHFDMAIPKATAARGVIADTESENATDAEWLAEELRDLAMDAGLLTTYSANRAQPRAARAA